jgi:tRNA 2-selenouridine synthase
MGGQHVKTAVQFLEEDRMEDWLNILLDYYDKTYSFGNELRKSDNIRTIDIEWKDTSAEAAELIKQSKNFLE